MRVRYVSWGQERSAVVYSEVVWNRNRLLGAGFPPRRPGSGQVGFVVNKMTLEQVLSEYFGFPGQSSFQQLLHNHHHLSSGAGKIGK
jgi:hypothetical protein